MNTKTAITFLLAVLLAGCATSAPPKGRPDLLDFLVDGQSTRTEILTTLGQPAGRFEADHVITYRLGCEPKNRGYYVVEREARLSGWPTWTQAKFSLVLVFDPSGVLQKHSLVKVNK